MRRGKSAGVEWFDGGPDERWSAQLVRPAVQTARQSVVDLLTGELVVVAAYPGEDPVERALTLAEARDRGRIQADGASDLFTVDFSMSLTP